MKLSKHHFVWFRWVLLVAIGYCLGQANQIPNEVSAQQRNSNERKAFLSGGERSELVLEKMNKTLERMDQRLGNIEKATLQMAAQKKAN